MKFLVDTDVFSAIAEPAPNADQIRVQNWFAGLSDADFGIPVLSLYERQWGIELLHMKGSPKADVLKLSLGQFLHTYRFSFVAVDIDMTLLWPAMTLKTGKRHLIDAGILACASARALTVATRNYKDFRLKGVPLINPFKPHLDPHDGVTP